MSISKGLVIHGMPTTGKSTCASKLQGRGFKVFDTDDAFFGERVSTSFEVNLLRAAAESAELLTMSPDSIVLTNLMDAAFWEALGYACGVSQPAISFARAPVALSATWQHRFDGGKGHPPPDLARLDEWYENWLRRDWPFKAVLPEGKYLSDIL